MKILLAVTAAGEAAMGLALLAYPPVVIQLLFGAEIAGAGVVLGRVTGISLVALGMACWPHGAMKQALCSMLTYSLLITLYFVFLGLGGVWVGILLWPVAVGHAVLTVLLAWAWLNERARKL